MTSTNTAHLVTTPVTTPLSQPYYYRRHGVYYMRLRPVGSLKGHAVSLRTTDRSHAMTASQDLRNALRGFHLDNPGATWEEIRGAIREFALEALAADHSDDPMQQYGMVYADLRGHLTGHAMTASMSHAQALGVNTAVQALRAAESRLSGDLGPLVGIVEALGEPSGDLQEPASLPTDKAVCLSPSVKSFPKGTLEETTEATTFRALADAYLGEHSANVKTTTLKGITATLNGLSIALGDTNMMTHTRTTMTDLKSALCEGRANATVNKMLSTLMTVLEWSVNTGMIERHYAKGLKIRKDAESDRKAFTEAQVATIMTKAQEDHSDASQVIQLAALTGARLNEVLTLTKEDVREVAGVLVIDINEAHDHKSLKNKGSARLVPLVAAYGFDLEAFLELVAALPAGGRLFPNVTHNTGRTINAKLRTFHGLDDKALVLHSLRHSLATSMKSQGVTLAHAQVILGHSSGAITWDLYGRSAMADLVALADALKAAHGVSLGGAL